MGAGCRRCRCGRTCTAVLAPGLALIGPISFVAIWDMQLSASRSGCCCAGPVGVAALAASRVTPDGWRTLLGATNILNLGELLSVIAEWMPVRYRASNAFEGALPGLTAIGLLPRRRCRRRASADPAPGPAWC